MQDKYEDRIHLSHKNLTVNNNLIIEEKKNTCILALCVKPVMRYYDTTTGNCRNMIIHRI